MKLLSMANSLLIETKLTKKLETELLQKFGTIAYCTPLAVKKYYIVTLSHEIREASVKEFEFLKEFSDLNDLHMREEIEDSYRTVYRYIFKPKDQTKSEFSTS